MMAPTTASTIPNVAKPMPEFLLMGPKCKLTALRGRGQPDERLAVGEAGLDGLGARRAQTGSHRQPSLSSQTIFLPSPARPDAPWSALRQNSPGS